jgi:crotonobetainyl-CoA:carnitine CoA-transferase CaiB-like acyl-CoA transferase
MTKVLEGVKVVEISAWAFVPSAGAVLADWGATVVKIEPPTGDPLRGLVSAGVTPIDGVNHNFEIWNRGKKAIALDLRDPAARQIVLDLARDADVFLTSYLPSVRQKLGIDQEDILAVNPSIIFACGSGQGAAGLESDRGGYDLITFWSRGSISSAVTPPGYPHPIGMPSGAFGDSLSGMALAGGIAGALLQREKTGASVRVDGSLLGTAMWCMQMAIVGASVAGSHTAPPPPHTDVQAPNPAVANALVYSYRTSDDRWIALCMLQPDLFFDGLVRALGRPDMTTDDRFDSPTARRKNGSALLAELQTTFSGQPLDHWQRHLAMQPGQWDVVRMVSEMTTDPQAIANGFVQPVDYGDQRFLPLISSPVQHDRTPPVLIRAPLFAGDTDEVLGSIGMTESAVIEAKIAGYVI